MGIINKGVNGPFRGKAGSVIGSGWKKIDYIKGRPRPYKNRNTPSEAQVLHRKKFTLLNKFLVPTEKMLNIGFSHFTSKSTSHNAAFKHNFPHAFLLNEGGELTLNYPALQFSRGSLFSAGAEKVELLNNRIRISWNTKTYGLSGELDDEIHVLAYYENLDIWDTDEDVALRYQGETYVEIDDDAKPGELIHIWLFFSDSEHKRVSPTTYLSITNHVN